MLWGLGFDGKPSDVNPLLEEMKRSPVVILKEDYLEGWYWVNSNEVGIFRCGLYELEPPNDLLCRECGQERPDDDRVAAGMRCRFCAYGVPQQEPSP